jgi:hypothetical protein
MKTQSGDTVNYITNLLYTIINVAVDHYMGQSSSESMLRPIEAIAAWAGLKDLRGISHQLAKE